MVTTQDNATEDPQRTIEALKQQLDESRAERDAAQAQEAALSEVLEVINRSPGDPGSVFDAILEKALRLCGAAFGTLYTYDGKRFRATAMRGLPAAYTEFRAKHPPAGRPGGGPARMLETKRPLHILDLRDEAFYQTDAERRTMVALTGARSCLGVPLLKDEAMIGFVSIYRQDVRAFSDKQIVLLENFAAQAVIAMENARLITEQREALEQQTATAEVLRVINASPGNLAPVFEVMLEKATRLCDSSFGTLVTYNGESFNHVAGRGVPPVLAEFFRAPIEPSPGMTLYRVVHGEDVVEVADITDDEVYRSGNPARRALADLGGARTQLLVALRKADTLLGAFNIFRQDVRPFSDKQIALLRNFAAQAVIAIENARLLGELQERTAALAERNNEYGEQIEQQSATIDVLKVMSSSPGDARPVFDLIAKRARAFCEAETSAVVLFDGELMHLQSYSGITGKVAQDYEARFPQPANSTTVFGRAIHARDAVHLRDTQADPAFSMMRLTEAMALRSLVGVPMLRAGTPIGAITLARVTPGGFSATQVELLRTFSEQAVIAIGSAETYRELQERTAALAKRNIAFSEQVEHQSATIDVLKAMSASPGNAQPVFDLIVHRAAEVCNAPNAVLFRYDGELLHWQATSGTETYASPEAFDAIKRRFPMAPSRTSLIGRTVLGRQIVHVRDIDVEPELYQALHDLNTKSLLSVPLMRDDTVLGALGISAREAGGFSDTQVALLQTFAEQAAIAISSAETYRELQERTAALALRNSEYGERIEQQSATIDVLKVMSSSPGDAQPVFELIARRALDFCGATGARLTEFDGQLQHLRALVRADGLETEADQALRQMYPAPPDLDSITGRVILQSAIVHTREEVETPSGLRGRYAGSVVGIPLLRDDRVVGAIVLSRSQPGGFAETQIELLQTFAEQAVIAISSAETYRALQERTAALAERNSEYGERIEHQSATIDVLKAMSASPDDTQPVFDLIARRAQQLCNGASVGMFEFDGNLVYARASSGGNQAAIAAFQGMFPMAPTRESLACRAILDRQIVHVPDMNAEPGLLPAVRNLGAKSTLSLPLLRDGRAIGAMSLNAWEVGGFSDNQIELLKTFAEQAVIAVGSAETFRELRARTAELTRSVSELQALEEVLRAVNSSLDLDTVLATIISRAVQLSQADEGTIYEFDETDEVFVPKAAFGMTPERVEWLRERKVRLGETHLGRSAVLRAPVHIDDVQQDPTMADAGGLLRGIHAVLAVPLLREDNVVGGLVIRRRTAGGFAPTIPTLLQTFAGQAVLAIENAQLFQDARRARATAEATLVDLRRTQDRLVQSEKMASLGQLTAGIAHEIKNPLNFVNNFSDLSVDLLDELHGAVAPDKLAIAADLRAEIDDLTATLKGNLEKIAQHGRRADSIVKNMLLHSRSGPSEHRAIDLNTMVEEALNLAYHGARAQDQSFNITLERDFGEDIATIELSPQDMTRVLLNLFSNGFYAARKRQNSEAESGFEPVLKVTTRDIGDAAEIRVWDNGTGIPADIKDKLFQPFFTTKPTGEGTGLGLSISYDVVTQQHGGTITIESEVGAYTEFTITIPRLATAVSDDHSNYPAP